MDNGLVTNYHLDNSEWYTTKVNDEVILFTDHFNTQRKVCNWLIMSKEEDLIISYVKLNSRGEISYISDKFLVEAGAMWGNDALEIHGLKIWGNKDKKLRWTCNFR